jgi:hypothetical protein
MSGLDRVLKQPDGTAAREVVADDFKTKTTAFSSNGVYRALQIAHQRKEESMKVRRLAAVVAIVVGLTLGGGFVSPASAAGNEAFSFNAPVVSGFPGGRSVEITGGGAYSLPDFVHAGGSFGCLSDISAGRFDGCLAGQGVRWDTAMVLPSTTFRCTGAVGETLKAAETGDKTVVLLADFYRQGDGNDESFTAQMIVSETDLDPVAPGVQNIWIQQVGCGTGITNFN